MKQVFTIHTSEKDTYPEKVLSMRIGERHFGFAVTTPDAAELFHLGWFAGEEIDDHLLQQIYLQEESLKGPFEKVQLCFDHPQSVLVPLPHYKEADHQLFLEAIHGINGKENILSESVEGWQLNNVYAVPAKVHDWVKEHFMTGQFQHGYTLGIKHMERTNFEGSLNVDVRNDDFSLVASKGNKLLLVQTYAYATPADVLYHLLNTCQLYSLSQESVRVSLSGLVDKESALYRELYQYFIHLRFREPSWHIRSEAGESYPPHFFTTLNDLAQCES